MHHVAIPSISHLFHQCFAQTHVNAALDLTHNQRGIDRLADIVSNPDSLHYHDSSFRIDVHLGNRGRIAVGWRRPDARAFVLARRSRRRVRAYRADHAKLRFSKLHCFGKGHAAITVFDVEHSTIRE